MASASNNNRIKKFYNRFTFFYPVVDVFLARQKKKLTRSVCELPPSRVLEIGIGTGSHIPHYEKHTLTGIDISERSVKIAGRRKQNTKIELMVMDGESLLFADNSFDAVVLSHVIAVTPNPEIMLRESFRVLKKGGKLFILNHDTPDNFMRHLDKAFSLVSGMFRFSSFFRINELESLKLFSKEKEQHIGFAAYYKLLTLKKLK